MKCKTINGPASPVSETLFRFVLAAWIVLSAAIFVVVAAGK